MRIFRNPTGEKIIYIDGIKDSCLVFEQVRKIAKQYIEGSYN